jgi:hypothetical protein
MALLRQLHESVLVPPAVWQEVAVGGKGLPESDQLRSAVAEGWIEVRSPAALLPLPDWQAATLGRGELEAMALAKELGALLLTDDLDGRQIAESVGLQVTGTVGILIRAKHAGHISQLRLFMDKLRHETNSRMSDGLYLQVLTEGGESASGASETPLT